MDNKSRNSAVASDLYHFCKEWEIWNDTAIYFNGKCWASWDTWHDEKGEEIEPGIFEYIRDPRDYMTYCNPDGVSVSFEGGLYNVVNSFGAFPYDSAWEELNGIFEAYGYSFELGTYTTLYSFEI